MKKAILFYGVFEETLSEIALGGSKDSNKIYYLQPKTGDSIKILEDPQNLPLTLFLTTSNDINTVSYQCNVVKWENKQEADVEYLEKLSNQIKLSQPSEETGVFLSFDGTIKSKHLIHVCNMKKLKNKFSLSELMLVSSGKPCKNRTQGGGHAVVYLPEEEVESIVLDIFELSDPLASTSTVSLVNARVGQGKFRKNVIDSWGNDEVCALTGITTKPLLVASHIKPWSQCQSDAERLDGANGILLAAHIDKLFDSYLITFKKKDSGFFLVSSFRLENSTLKELNLYEGMELLSGYLSIEVERRVSNFLEYHNEIFDKINIVD